LLDVSNDGFGVVASGVFKVGAAVKATLSHDGKTFSGRERVCSVSRHDDGMYRYGCQALEGQKRIRLGLQQVSSSEQRAQLRRLSNQ